LDRIAKKKKKKKKKSNARVTKYMETEDTMTVWCNEKGVGALVGDKHYGMDYAIM
jgi:hypothetical protein